MVNRIWQVPHGIGPCAHSNDFGVPRRRPATTARLDWLSTEFMECNWSVKAIDRLIVLSNTYRQSAVDDPVKSKTPRIASTGI